MTIKFFDFIIEVIVGIGRVIDAIFLVLGKFEPSKSALRGFIYFALPFLTAFVERWKVPMTDEEFLRLNLVALVSALTTLRAYIDQTITQENPPPAQK